MRLWPCIAGLILLAPASARAQAHTVTPITDNSYNLELFQGPILAPLRVTGLAGAYGPYAEGIEGIPANAAATGVREPFSVNHFDYDVSASLAFPGAFKNTDFDNDGHVGFTYGDFIFYTLGGMVQIGRLGIGSLGEFQRYNLSPNAGSGDPHSTLTIGRIHVQAAWSFFENQLAIGGGVRAVWLNIDTSRPGQDHNYLRMAGVAPEVGMLVRPDYQPWRIGATFRAPVRNALRLGDVEADPQGVKRSGGLAVPNDIYLPWELQAGFAMQVGPRPLNPKWIDPYEQEQAARDKLMQTRRARRNSNELELASIADPVQRARRKETLENEEVYLQQLEEKKLEKVHDQMLAERRARYWNWPRQYVLVVAEALLTGPSPDAVGLEAFLSQEARRSGENVTVSPRLGFEGEPVINAIKTRFGTYIEPARYTGSVARQHFTFGFDVRVFEFKGWGILGPSIFRVSGMADLAPRYENFGVSFGAWH